MDFTEPIQISRRKSELITIPRLVPFVRTSGYFYNILVVLIVMVSIILGMAKLVFGAIFFKKCTLQPLIPVYLIVDTCFGLLIPWTIENKDKDVALRMQFALGLFHIVGLVCGTLWVIEVSQEIYAVGHCAMTTPSTALLFTTLDVNMTSTATTVVCATCSDVLVQFTTAVIAVQWLIAVLAMFNGTMVIIKHYFSEDSSQSFCQTEKDEESQKPIYNQ